MEVHPVYYITVVVFIIIATLVTLYRILRIMPKYMCRK
jgi:hypothetical protein